MEHDKKKKGKKKKNKQGKTSATAGVGELTSENNNHANTANQKNHQNVNSDGSDVPKRGLQQAVVDSDRESISGAETSRSVEAEKSYWLNRESSLEQKIKELQEQLDIHVQREADLERNISQSQKERNSWHHKETELEATISQLQTEKCAWLQKEAACEEKLNQLVEETSALRSMEACFEEKRIQMETEKVDLALRENSAAETIASLIKDNAKLHAQVIELETTSNNISHQNQQLKEHVSDLQSKIQDLENSVATHLSSERTRNITAYEGMNLQLESAQALVAKLLSENDILVEKVNVLKTELDQKTATTQSSSPIKPVDPLVKISKAADMDETSTTETDSMLSSAETDTVSNMGPSDTLVNHMHSEGSNLNQISRVSMESGEIVQISLNEIDVAAATSAIYVPEDSDPVPITDAPLIGAPFRFISFVARYVSGADLVQK
ncbi:hypothetical protein L1987_83060 [Smallanthus sonchifolius]|uniref:Uncharacterized protein n=1 Tax=Smallanthus sonchifolius TaxID=185202 RepID=A0ACB8YC63_9ASTR|nr:hypothetical protein L1987_83060 [Smallanthus sonchifolius]